MADYIPALAKADPRAFGMALTTVGGAQASIGAAAQRFSLQSISKVFTLTLALEAIGQDLWRRVGREPSGNPFNSLVQLEHELGIPRNPLINAGAIVATDVLVSRHGSDGALDAIVGLIRTVSRDQDVGVNREVAESERAWGHRNAALANFMKSFGNLDNRPDEVLDVYFRQCAIELDCIGLSRAMVFLAASGRDPASGQEIVSAQRARRINALMLTCGHYDASGDFAFRVGLPGKSGVGGGIAAVAPGALAVAVWPPGLNRHGNSLVGTLALEELSRITGHSIF